VILCPGEHGARGAKRIVRVSSVLRLGLAHLVGFGQLGHPLIFLLLTDYLRPELPPGMTLNVFHPLLMAGWVGMLVTGLNMLPVSQLDGGHVTYALFGRKAHWLARGFMLVALCYMVIMYFVYGINPGWILMVVLVLVMGTDHPPTRDDTARLGWLRTAIGYASLLIPIFCFVPNLQL
jgi:membrane-associated protease RseP (regulator of RpoE activity)